jgi:hypothetical protein
MRRTRAIPMMFGRNSKESLQRKFIHRYFKLKQNENSFSLKVFFADIIRKAVSNKALVPQSFNRLKVAKNVGFMQSMNRPCN